MHFEILVEDQSGKKMLNIIVPKIIGNKHTFRVIPYKGIGNIPKNMKNPKDVTARILLDNLPKLLRGFGKTFKGYGSDYNAVVFVICDLDEKCLKSFRQELFNILNQCYPKQETR